MSVEILTPTLPESVSDATVAAWHKQPGEEVSRGDTLLDLETDKVVLEVPAPADGVLQEHTVEEGGVVEQGQMLGKIGDAAAATADTASGSEANATQNEPPTLTQPQANAASTASAQAESSDSHEQHDTLSPAVKRLVDEYHLNPEQIKPSGKDGRLTKEDVLNFVKQDETTSKEPDQVTDQAIPLGDASKPEVSQEAPKEEPPAAASTPTQAAASKPAQAPDKTGRMEERVPMTRLRKTIAQRLVDAQHTAAMLTTFNEVNMQPIMDLRARYKDDFEKVHGTRLGFMSFFVQAAVEALKKFPAVNASIDGDDIVYHGFYDVGIAVSTPRGLMVPILRNADQLTTAGLEESIREFGSRGKDGKLSMDDLTGGTFSITNGGVFGSMMSTPILNPPQSAILGMHAINDRAVVENGEVVVRPMMYLALTYDHRIVDGREAVQFLVTIKNAIEDPARLLLHL